MQSRAEYRDWLRRQLGIVPPRDEWLLLQEMGQTPDYPMPPAGAQPTDNLQVLNSTLNQVITNAANRVTVEARFPDAITFTDIPISAQTATGPLTLRLSGLPGFADRAVVRIRRSYWQDSGSTQSNWQQVTPVLLSQLDVQNDDYMNQGPGQPFRVALEGDLLYIIPGPQSDGTFRLTVGTGALAPMNDLEGFDGLPSSYDEQILYQALSEMAIIPTVDPEMRERAAAFLPLAERGLINITSWVCNGGLDEWLGTASWSTSVIRYPRAS